MSTKHKHEHGIECNINWQLTDLCANISAIVYNDLNTVTEYLKTNKIKYSSIKMFDKDNAEGYGIIMHDYVIIAFRGTGAKDNGELSVSAAFKDFLADVKAWPSESDTQGSVHSGFKTEIDKLWPQVTKWLGKKVTTKKLVITGHSLGAAMATICASRLHALGADLVLYTFGSPRVGDNIWAKQFDNIEAYRIVNNNDIVCRVPPFGYYSHVGFLHYITYDHHIKTDMTGWQMFKDRLKGIFKALSKFQPFDAVYDHPGKQYVKKIKCRK